MDFKLSPNEIVKCTAGHNYFLLYPNGDIYRCMRFYVDRHEALGNIKNFNKKELINLLGNNSCEKKNCFCGCDIDWASKWVVNKENQNIERKISAGVMEERFGLQKPESISNNQVHIIWTPTLVCNYNCDYCSCAPIKPELIKMKSAHPELTDDEWVEAFEKIYVSYDKIVITLSGGEPFIKSKTILSVLSKYQDKMFFSITTNASFPLIEFVSKVNPNSAAFNLSLHPSDKKFNFDQFFGRALLLKNRGFNVQINFVSYPEQIYLFDYYKEIFDKYSIPIDMMPWVGNNRLNTASSFDNKTFTNIEKEYLNKKAKHEFRKVDLNNEKKINLSVIKSHDIWCREFNLDKEIINSVINNEYCMVVENLCNIKGPVMDVGAHIGSFIKFIRNYGYKGKVYAYEAHPENFTILNKNKKDFFDDDIHINEAAIWNNNLEKLFITKEASGNSGGVSVIINQNDVIKVEKILSFDEEVDNILKVTNSDKIDLLKIDCEGAEFPILLNSLKLNSINNIIGEYHIYLNYHISDLITKMKEAGFKILTYPHPQDNSLGLFFAYRNENNLVMIDKYKNFEQENILDININFEVDNYIQEKRWNKTKEIGVFYYTWYINDNWKNQVVRNNYGTPLLGWYNSSDTNIINEHFNMAEKYNIDFFISSYHGKDKEKILLESLCHEANNRKVKIAPHLELVNVLGDPVKIGSDTDKWLMDSVDFFCTLNNFYPNAFKKIDNKLVIYIYTSRRLKTNLQEFDRIRKFAHQKYNMELYLIGDEIWWEILDKEYHTTIIERSKKLDAIYGYSLYVPNNCFDNKSYIGIEYLNFIEPAYKWFNENINKPIFPVIKPRFNDAAVRKGNYPIPPQNGKFFMDYYDMVQKYYNNQNNTLLITSWNEWYEDTQIEPFISLKNNSIKNYDNEVNYNSKYLEYLKYFKV